MLDQLRHELDQIMKEKAKVLRTIIGDEPQSLDIARLRQQMDTLDNLEEQKRRQLAAVEARCQQEMVSQTKLEIEHWSEYDDLLAANHQALCIQVRNMRSVKEAGPHVYQIIESLLYLQGIIEKETEMVQGQISNAQEKIDE